MIYVCDIFSTLVLICSSNRPLSHQSNCKKGLTVRKCNTYGMNICIHWKKLKFYFNYIMIFNKSVSKSKHVEFEHSYLMKTEGTDVTEDINTLHYFFFPFFDCSFFFFKVL